MAHDLTFGRWLKQRRIERDMTQEALAALVGCAVQTIRKLESGERRPSRPMAERLVEVLEVPPAERAAMLRLARALLAPEPPAPAPQAPKRTPLPSYRTPLVGRHAELQELNRMLSARDYRLVTLLGPGGIGKTRLAVEAAMHSDAPDGVAFVQLAAVLDSSALAPAIADALGFAFHDARDPAAQLHDFLRSKQMVLILDNLEQVRGASDFVLALLEQAPGITLLTTSRERLQVQDEWVVELHGLPLDAEEGGISDAVALFVERARRVVQDFALGRDDRARAERICRLVGGMPLGIELAAAWVRVLPLAEIATEIERDIDFLQAAPRDVPERHRSLRAVIEHSWRLLPEAERKALRTLSVFRGGFSQAGAAAVAGASLALLRSLADKSFLRRVGTGRYDMHELMRQFAAAQLESSVSEERAARERHALFYVDWLHEREAPLRRYQQRSMLLEIGAEIDNIRLAWDWAVREIRLDALERALPVIDRYYELRCLFEEGAAAFGKAAAALQAVLDTQPGGGDADTRRVLGRMLAKQAWFFGRLGRVAEGTAIIQQSFELLRTVDAPAALAETVLYMGLGASHQGNYEVAAQLLKDGVALGRASNSPAVVALALTHLGIVTQAQGDLDAAHRLLIEALAAWRSTGEPRATAYTLGALSNVSLARDDYATAEALLRESLAISEAQDDRLAIGITYAHLGRCVQAGGAIDEALLHFERSLAVFRELGERWSLAGTLTMLAAAQQQLGRLGDARRSFREALRTALDVYSPAAAMDALLGLTEIDAAEGHWEQGLIQAYLLVTHESSSRTVVERATELRDHIVAQLGTLRAAELERYARSRPLEALIAEHVGSVALDRDVLSTLARAVGEPVGRSPA